MNFHRKQELPPELRDIDAALRRSRPSMDEDRIRRVVAGVKSRRVGIVKPRYSKESFLRTRLAITAMLVVGFALSGAGAGLAVSGISGDDSSSSSAEYSQPPTTTTTTTAPTTTTTATTPLLPTTQTTPPASGQLGEQDQGEAPEETTAPEEQAEVAQPQEPRQLGAETGGSELPFTGWAAVPVLLIGLALVGAGLTLRRGLSKQS